MHQILGQDHAVSTLHAALAAGRLHHAWVFHGPSGVGKFTTALALAHIILDPEAGPDLSGLYSAPPGSLVASMIASETHGDLHIIRKELAEFSQNPDLRNRKQTNIPLDLLREHMIGGTTSDDRYHDPVIGRTPAHGHAKVFIIDEAQLLRGPAQNALLKTLEEPPERTWIFLITDRPSQLLPTIQSRCQQIAFGQLDDEAMATWCDQAEGEYDLDERSWLTRWAQGSPGRVIAAQTHDLLVWYERLAPRWTNMTSGVIDLEVGELMADFVQETAATIVGPASSSKISKEGANRTAFGLLLSMISMHVRTTIAHEVVGGGLVDPWIAVVDLMVEAEMAIESNVNLKQVLNTLAARWGSLACVS
jgi:hypothetical protein